MPAAHNRAVRMMPVGGRRIVLHATAPEIHLIDISGKFSVQAGEPSEGDDTQHLVIGSLALDMAFLESLGHAAKIWVLLPPQIESRLSTMSRPEARALIEPLCRSRGIFVQSTADLLAVTGLVPRWAALVENLSDRGVSGAAQSILPRSLEHEAVLVNAGGQWHSHDLLDSNIHFMVDRASDLSAAPVRREHWLPAEPDRRDADGFIDARRIAWYLMCAVEATGARWIVVDRVDVLVMLLTSPNITAKVAFLVSSASVMGLMAHPPRNLHGVLAKLKEQHGAVLVEREIDVPHLKKLGYEGHTQVFDPGASPSVQPVVELVRRSRPIAELPEGTTLLLAGHDFKFLGELVQVLENVPRLDIIYDEWTTQARNDVSQSCAKLEKADIIFCEFASHNAVWYSWHKRPGQRLVVHFHGYELFQPWMKDINLANVDQIVFVSEFYRDRVVRELDWPVERTTVIPNMVNMSEFDLPKGEDSRFHLGIAGIVPILKRPDRALDLLEMLVAQDDRYVLHIRGRSPWDYRWMWDQPAVRDAYEAVYERLTDNPELLAHVSFDPFGADMGQWFRRIGWTLSPSYRETFHLAPVEGQASAAVPVVWQREGAEEIFPSEWVHANTRAAARYLLDVNADPQGYAVVAERAQETVKRFDISAVGPRWADVLFGPRQQTPRIAGSFDRDKMLNEFREKKSVLLLERVILLLLIRDSDLDRVEQLLREYPELSQNLSRMVRALVDESRAEATFESGGFVRPVRCSGVAYLPRHGCSLMVSYRAAVDELGELRSPSSAEEETLLGRVDIGVPGEDLAAFFNLDTGTGPLDCVQLVADAVVRATRVERPSALMVEPEENTAWATVLAARRLGVPAILVGEIRVGDRIPPAEEFDAVVPSLEHVTDEVLDNAVVAHRAAATTTAGVPLARLTVGMIADEFTERTVAGRCNVVHIPRKSAYLQVVSHHLDVLFIESAWSGRDNEWFHGIAYYQDSRDDIERAIETARCKGIPVIFWNKEDPIHFRSFAPTAALCDAVYTTDADRVPAYLRLGTVHHPPVVASMPFYAEPRLHNPIPGSWAENATVSYAGTYYGARYADRSAELDRLLGTAAEHGLTIYDRQVNVPNSPYHFPDRYKPFIHGGLSYDEVLEAYKAHPIHVNVNSVSDSPTMFSRRVVEIAASGSVVVSGRGRGVQECLPAVPNGDNAAELGAIMGECLTDQQAWRHRAWQQLRAVRRSYLAEQALTIMFRGAGIPVTLEDETSWSAVVAHLDVAVARNLLAQTHRPAAVAARTADGQARQWLAAQGIPVVAEPVGTWSARWTSEQQATWAEDLMYAARFVPEDVSRIGGRPAGDDDRGLIAWNDPCEGTTFERSPAGGDRTLVWLFPDRDAALTEESNA